MTPPVVLSVAGTDSGGAAGTAADLATFAALGVHGACAITAVTAQDTTGVHAVHPVPTAIVAAQWRAVYDDLPLAAVKTGMLGSAATVRLLRRSFDDAAAAGERRPVLVVDPVLVATSGAVLGDEEVQSAYVTELLPIADVVTPNLDEARGLARTAGIDPDLSPRDLAAALAAALLPAHGAVVLTGITTDTATATDTVTDWVAAHGAAPIPVRHPRVATVNDHGTGCTYSAALASYLAHGRDLGDAATAAAAFVVDRLVDSSDWDLGAGRGPVSHRHPSVPPHAGTTTGTTTEGVLA